MMESLISIILKTVLISILIKLIIYHYNRLNLYKIGNKIPGPWPVLPILGNAHLFYGSIDRFMDRLLMLDGYEFSPIRFWFGPKLCVVVFNPEQVKAVLRSPKAVEKDDLYNIVHPLVGQGILTAPAKKWKVIRKLIEPTFHPRILESFIDALNKQSEILVKVMEPKINGDEFDIYPYISRCTLDMICETEMGVSTKEQTNRGSNYVEVLDRVKQILNYRILKIWLHPDVIFNSTKLARDQAECMKYLHGYIDNLISQKREQYSEKKNNEDDTETTGSKKKVFLDSLMELSNKKTKLTDEELHDEVITVMIAANDSSAIANSFFIFMLANFPEIQEKCYQELVEIFGDEINKGRQIENEDLKKMEYLERVIKETLRLFPAVPIVIRQVTDDFDIGGGYTAPKGSTAVLPILKMHRSAEIWDDPLSFNPDRFLPEEVAKRHPYAYIPFSAGPRNCIGLKYAMMSMKILLATLLRNYMFIKDEYVKIEDIGLKAEIFIKASKPLTVKIKRRQ